MAHHQKRTLLPKCAFNSRAQARRAGLLEASLIFRIICRTVSLHEDNNCLITLRFQKRLICAYYKYPAYNGRVGSDPPAGLPQHPSHAKSAGADAAANIGLDGPRRRYCDVSLLSVGR